MTAAVSCAYTLFRISIEEENTALSAVAPIALAGAGRIIIGNLVFRKVTFLTHMGTFTRHRISGTAAFVLSIAIEKQHAAINALSPVILIRCGKRGSQRRT